MPPLPPQQAPPVIIAPMAQQPQQSVQPPAYDPRIFGGYKFQPTAEMQQRVRDFLTTYATPKKLNEVVLVPGNKWANFLFDFRIPAGNGEHPAVSINDRAYLNADLFNKKDPTEGPEWLLAHELQHLNDSRSKTLQEYDDKSIDAEARNGLDRWIRQRAKANGGRN